MPKITFQPTLRDVKAVLTEHYFVIPRFQRPYSWNAENIDEFWRDVIDENDLGYFIGPMVAYPEASRLAMVDGQQRLTTIMLAISAVRDALHEIGAHRLVAGIEKYIERPDDDDISHYVLESTTAQAFLQHQFLKREPRPRSEASSDEERALRHAAQDLRARIGDELESLDVTHPDGADSSQAARRLKEIRDRLLALQLVWITIDNEDDAYSVFETLNSRGKDLEVIDLLKNQLLRVVRAENGDLDLARAGWMNMRETLEAASANPNKFVLHWWLSAHDYTAERKLFKAIRSWLKDTEPQTALADLQADAALYKKIAAPDTVQWPREQIPIRNSLRALNIFGVRQPRPLLLSLLRAYANGKVSLKVVKSALGAVESYHFATTAVAGVSSTGGISQLYASHARKIACAKSNAAVSQQVRALVKKLQSSMTSRETFLNEFGLALYYSSAHADRKKLVQYTLSRLARAMKPNMPLDDERCNIEHLEPQSAGSAWAEHVGNLLWIDEGLNGKLGHLPFSQKLPILKEYASQYDLTHIEDVSTWDEDAARARAAYLAAWAYDKVWRVAF